MSIILKKKCCCASETTILCGDLDIDGCGDEFDTLVLNFIDFVACGNPDNPPGAPTIDLSGYSMLLTPLGANTPPWTGIAIVSLQLDECNEEEETLVSISVDISCRSCTETDIWVMTVTVGPYEEGSDCFFGSNTTFWANGTCAGVVTAWTPFILGEVPDGCIFEGDCEMPTNEITVEVY